METRSQKNKHIQRLNYAEDDDMIEEHTDHDNQIIYEDDYSVELEYNKLTLKNE